MLSDAFLLDPYQGAPGIDPVEIWIARRTDGNIKGCGTLNDPFDASSAERFDAILNGIPPGQPVRVHLGPASAAQPFQTRGFWIAADGTTGGAWQPRPRMVISGSGMDVTCLQLVVSAPVDDRHYFAIGASTTVPLDLFDLSDLTIDCGLPSDETIACGAVRLLGNSVRIRRVKCVNWGSRTTAQPGFVIALVAADPDPGSPTDAANDAGIEDCVAIEPSPYNNISGAVVNVLHIGGRERASVFLPRLAHLSFIRRCYVAGSSPTASGAELRALSLGACRGGVLEYNHVQDIRIGGPYQNVLETRDLVVRYNTYRNVLKGPCWEVGTLTPDLLAPDATAELARTGAVATITMPRPHKQLALGDRVVLETAVGGSAFDGYHEVTGIPEIDGILQTHQFTFATAASDISATVTSIQKVLGVQKLWVEGNHIELAAGTPSPTPIGIQLGDEALPTGSPPYVHGQAIIRHNRIRYLDGVMGDFSGYAIDVAGAKAVFLSGNIIEVAPEDAIRQTRCGLVRYHDNRTPSGELLEPPSPLIEKFIEELERPAEDAWMLSLLASR